jgi:hypothetical protein
MSGKTFCVMLGLLLSAMAVGAQSAQGEIIIDPNLVGWWPFEEGQGTVALDASGHGNHATLVGGPQWAPGYDGLALDFDGQGDYLDTGKVPSQLGIAGDAPRTVALWACTRSFNGGGLYEMGGDGTREGFSLRTQDIDGGWQARYGGVDATFVAGSLNEWVHLTHVYDFDYILVYVNGREAAYNWGEVETADGKTFRIGVRAEDSFDGYVDDVRLYDRMVNQNEIARVMQGSPLLAWPLQPPDGGTATIDSLESLAWSSGALSAAHDIYFGTDQAAVRDATTEAAGIYRGRQTHDVSTYVLPEAPLQWDTAYYWRIDEIGIDGTVSKGKVWSFTTVNYLIIDDFESYTDDIDAGEAIFDTWCDGWYNGTGSTVGYFDTGWHVDPVHGGRQSMPFTYDNVDEPWFSEVVRTWEPAQEWTRYGVDVLTLHFVGQPLAFLERADGSIVLGGANYHIGDTWDSFRLACKPLDGDGSITARIDSVAETGPNAKGGVMIRWGLESDSRNVALFVTASNGISFQYRREEKAATEQRMLAGPVPPYWLRISREGTTVVAECSADGVAWGPATVDPAASSVEMPAGEAFVGLAVATPGWSVTSAEFATVSVAGSDANEWQLADIGSSYEGNHSEPMYVELVDEAGHRNAVIHPDPLAVNAATWQRWDIPLSEFASAGVDVTAIGQMIVGFGDRDHPVPSGGGMVHFDDFWLTRSDAP